VNHWHIPTITIFSPSWWPDFSSREAFFIGSCVTARSRSVIRSWRLSAILTAWWWGWWTPCAQGGWRDWGRGVWSYGFGNL